MPFDSAPLPETLPDTLAPEVRRKRLIEALRSPMPEGFEWYFPSTRTCAAGLALRIGLIPEFNIETPADILGLWPKMSDYFGVPSAVNVFGCTAYLPIPGHAVTPQMVADRLESLPYVSP